MISFRNLAKGDEHAASEIEKSCLDTAWSERQILETPDNPNATYIVAICENEICGIGSMYCVAGEGQIMNIAVSEKYRRRGIAEGIMQSLIESAVKNNCENITLEVAENNISAISLYKKCGYAVIARRKGFYKGTDALIMEKALSRSIEN